MRDTGEGAGGEVGVGIVVVRDCIRVSCSSWLRFWVVKYAAVAAVPKAAPAAAHAARVLMGMLKKSRGFGGKSPEKGKELI